MKISKINIYNFGPYQGDNIIEFFTEKSYSQEKNISIIKAENGVGKTSFLKALAWCFYGDGIKEIKSFGLTSEASLDTFKNKELIHHNAIDKRCFIEVNLDNVFVNNKTYHLVIKRTKNFFNFDKNEKLNIIFKDEQYQELGKEEVEKILKGVGLLSEDNEQFFIHQNILDISLANYFFYDTEKMGKLQESNKKIGEIFSRFIGMKVYEDLKDIIKKIRKENEEKNEEIKDILKEINDKVREKGKHETEKGNSDIKIFEINKEIEEKKLSLKNEKEKGYRADKLVNEQENTLKSLKATKIELGNLKDRFKSNKELWTYWALFLHKDKIKEVNDSSKGRVSSFKNFVNSLYEKEEIKPKAYKKLIKAIEELWGKQEKTSGYTPSLDKNNWGILEEQEYFSNLSEFSLTHQELTDKIASLKDSYDILDKDIKGQASNNTKVVLERLESEICTLESSLEDERVEKGVLEERLAQIIKDCEKIDKKYKEKFSEYEGLKVCHDYSDKLDKFIVEFKKMKGESLNEKLTKYVKENLEEGKVDEVSFSVETGNITCYGIRNFKGNEYGKITQFSEGQKQVIMTSFIHALSEISVIKFPLIVDSPAIRLDLKNTQAGLKSFQQVAEHVILTPILGTEYTESFKQAINDYLVDVHEIKRVQKEKKSIFQKIR